MNSTAGPAPASRKCNAAGPVLTALSVMATLGMSWSRWMRAALRDLWQIRLYGLSRCGFESPKSPAEHVLGRAFQKVANQALDFASSGISGMTNAEVLSMSTWTAA